MQKQVFVLQFVAPVVGLLLGAGAILGQEDLGIVAGSRLSVEGSIAGSAKLLEKLDGADSRVLPRLRGPNAPAGKLKLEIAGSDVAALSAMKLAKDVTVRFTFQPVALPPAAYGKLIVQGSRVVLGEAGADHPSRYEFESIEMVDGAIIDLVGPVIITTGGLDRMEGVVGRQDMPGWLDLRIAARPLNLAKGAQVFGSVYAPASVVRMQAESRFAGWIAGDDVTVEKGSQVAATPFSWHAGSGAPNTPFPKRALLVQERLVRFVLANKGRLSADLDLSADVPHLTLAPVASRKADKPEVEERKWLFESCCLLFNTQGLDEARIVLPASSTNGSQRSRAIEIQMTKSDFEALVWAVSGEKTPGEGIRRIEAAPLLQTLLFERALRLHGGAGLL